MSPRNLWTCWKYHVFWSMWVENYQASSSKVPNGIIVCGWHQFWIVIFCFKILVCKIVCCEVWLGNAYITIRSNFSQIPVLQEEFVIYRQDQQDPRGLGSLRFLEIQVKTVGWLFVERILLDYEICKVKIQIYIYWRQSKALTDNWHITKATLNFFGKRERICGLRYNSKQNREIIFWFYWKWDLRYFFNFSSSYSQTI